MRDCLARPLPFATFLCLLWLCCRLAVLTHTGIPHPYIHDELSYLLGADTFAHGRLANPSPPLPSFFETSHILVRPTYASKYPPGQALFLAAGQVLLGSPFYGVLISDVLMLFSMNLMLFAWVSARWARRVSILLALLLSPGMFWTNSYWGGAVAASGGALVLLAAGKSTGHRKSLAATLFAIGILLLFSTRPYEGGVFSLAVLAVFGKRLWQSASGKSLSVAAAILLAGFTFSACVNHAVTGNAFELPYLLHAKQYDTTPVFWFQPMKPAPPYSLERLTAEYGPEGWEAQQYANLHTHRNTFQTWIKGLTMSVEEVHILIRFALLLSLVIPLAWRDSRYKRAFVISLAVVFALSLETFHFDHYCAPAWASFLLMIAVWGEKADDLERRSCERNGTKPIGLPFLVLVAPALLLFAFDASQSLRAQTPPQDLAAQRTSTPRDWGRQQFEMIQRLSAQGRASLVFVRYPYPTWNEADEWVYNSANIEAQKVVFAHDLGDQQDSQLLRYFPNRNVYLLTFNSETCAVNLSPYTQDASGVAESSANADAP